MRCIQAAVLSMALLWAATFLEAAQTESGSQGTAVALGAVSGLPKGQVMVPFYLTPDPPEVKIGSVSAAIAFENKGVTFVKVEKGFLLDGVGADFEADLQEDSPDPGHSVLRVKIATGGEERKALREGLLISLIFRIEENTPTGTKVPLTFQELSAADLESPPQPVQPVQGKPGSIEVTREEDLPYVGCFLFSH